MSKQGQNVKPTPDANTPPNVIANAALDLTLSLTIYR